MRVHDQSRSLRLQKSIAIDTFSAKKNEHCGLLLNSTLVERDQKETLRSSKSSMLLEVRKGNESISRGILWSRW